MDAERVAIAKTCLNAAHEGSLSFPEIIGTLLSAGFEGYSVDYRRNSQIYYLRDGDNVELSIPDVAGSVTETFDGAEIEALVRWAQGNGPDCCYEVFSRRAKAAGCAGYLVSFLGRRVVYYGRSADTHVERFPQ